MIKTMMAAAMVIGATASPAAAASIKAKYRCDNGTRINATFKNPASGKSSVVLAFPASGKTMTLPQGLSADGGRYVSGSKEFWVKGNSASWTRGRTSTTCRTRN